VTARREEWSSAVRVAVVDDDEIARSLLARRLADAQCGVVLCAEAASGQAGVHAAERTAPDVAIVDWSMPDMDGAEATAAIRAVSGGTQVVGWTSLRDPHAYRAFLEAGAARVFAKDEVGALIRYLRGAAAPTAPPGRGRPGSG